jgi:integrase
LAPIRPRTLAAAALVDIASGKDPRVEKRTARAVDACEDLVETVVSRFIERHAKTRTRQSSWTEATRILNKEIVGRWKGRRLASISRKDVYALLDSIVDRNAGAQANQTLAHFRTLCGWAVERGILDVSPCDRIKAPAPNKSRDRILSDTELRAVWNAGGELGRPFGPFVRMLILTAARRTEVAAMTWAEIDLDAGTWTLPAPRAKNGREHVLPLTEPAIAILRAMPRIGDFVFTYSGSNAITGFHNVKSRLDALLPADMSAWVMHDLRRTAASGMARLGINVAVVEKVLNHVSGTFRGIVGVYQRHDFADEKRIALDSWAAHVLVVAAGENLAGNVVSLRGVI